jgi:hypothetical protein
MDARNATDAGDATDAGNAMDAGLCVPPNAITFDASTQAGCNQRPVQTEGAAPCAYTLRCAGESASELHPDPTLMCKAIARPYPADVLDWCCPCYIHIAIH